jgi:hypothetical protein
MCTYFSRSFKKYEHNFYVYSQHRHNFCVRVNKHFHGGSSVHFFYCLAHLKFRIPDSDGRQEGGKGWRFIPSEIEWISRVSCSTASVALSVGRGNDPTITRPSHTCPGKTSWSWMMWIVKLRRGYRSDCAMCAYECVFWYILIFILGLMPSQVVASSALRQHWILRIRACYNCHSADLSLVIGNRLPSQSYDCSVIFAVDLRAFCFEIVSDVFDFSGIKFHIWYIY